MHTPNWKWFLATEKKKAVMVTLIWGLGIAFTFAQALLQRAYLTWVDYGIAFAICVLAGAVTIDLARALASYLGAMALAISLLLVMLTLPAFLGTIPPPGDVVITNLWIIVVFDSLFPFPLLGFLLATFLGASVGEQYL